MTAGKKKWRILKYFSFYNTSITNGIVTVKVKVYDEAGTCSLPYLDQYLLFSIFEFINSSLIGFIQKNYNGTYQPASVFLTPHQ